MPPAEFQWRDAGKLVVYRTRKAFDAAVAKPDSAATRQVLERRPNAWRSEPALAAAEDQLAGGIYNERRSGGRLLRLLRRRWPSACAPIRASTASSTARRAASSPTAAGVTGLRHQQPARCAPTPTCWRPACRAATWRATAGIDLPLYPLKGYSLTAPIRARTTSRRRSASPISSARCCTRASASSLRVAAMVDMVGEDLRLDPSRIDSLTRQVRETMPRAADYTRITAWAGLRPATPRQRPHHRRHAVSATCG